MLRLAWDGWLSWRGTRCLVLWTPWTGRRHSLHCLGWLRLRFPMLGCQGAEHSPGKAPTAALRHATSHTPVVAHMYITCTPMHTDMHQYRHTCYVCPPALPPVSNMHCRPAPIIGTCTLARSHTPPRVAAKLSWGTCQGTGAPRILPERLALQQARHHQPQWGGCKGTWTQAASWVGTGCPTLPLTGVAGWRVGAQGWVPCTGLPMPALTRPRDPLGTWWEHDGCTWWGGGGWHY